jgi:hypothetical protein
MLDWLDLTLNVGLVKTKYVKSALEISKLLIILGQLRISIDLLFLLLHMEVDDEIY